MHFIEIALIFCISFLIGYLVNLFKQPPLIGYILAGTCLGPLFLNLINSTQVIEELSHLGIAFLLYIVGLHLSEDDIKELGYKPILIGVFQVLLTFGVSFLILNPFFDFITSIICSFAVSLSSTIIIIKLVSDKDELDKLYSKILIAILLIQDIFATIFLIILNSMQKADSNLTLTIMFLFLKTIGIIIVLKFFTKYVITKILDSVAKNQELLFLFSVAWCFSISTLFDLIGLSIEIGALVGGILIASTPYQFEISSKIKPLRDFFVVLFFLILGLKIGPINLSDVVIIQILVLITLIIKPVITAIILRFFKYPKDVRFLSPISLTQISEFSLIAVVLASQYNLITNKIVTLVTISTIITIVISSYLINYNEVIFHFLVKKRLIKYQTKYEDKTQENYHIILFGYDRIGYSLFKFINKLKKKYLIVDYDPDIVKKVKRKNLNCIYGNAGDSNLLDSINFNKAKIVISTIPDIEVNNLLLRHVKKKSPTTILILTSHKINDALTLYNKGADYVILPHFLGGEFLSGLIERNTQDVNNILKEKIKHMSELQKRKAEGVEHPTYNNRNKK